MIKIERHPRGLLIASSEGAVDHVLMQQVEQVIGVARVFPTPRGLVVPLESAADILALCGSSRGAWDESLLDYARFQSTHRALQSRAQGEVAEALADPLATLVGYSRLPRLDAHQVSAVAAMTTPSLRGLGLFDEQGSGKTIMVLAVYDLLRERGQVERLLVVAPKSVLASWQTECVSFLDGQYRVMLVEGPSSLRSRLIMAPHDILLIGYETMTHELRLLQTVVAAKPGTYMLAVDESYFVKNAETARAKALAVIRPACERAIVLCGTPAPNSAVDIVNQITLADGGIAFGGRSVAGEQSQVEAEIASVLDRTIYLRRLKEEIFPEMPAKSVERTWLDLAPRQQWLYEHARDALIAAVRRVDDVGFTRQRATFLAQRMTLLQLCSHPGAVDEHYDEVPAKLLALDRLLAELVEDQQKKVVIWSYFRYSVDAICERFRHLGAVRIDGTVAKVEERAQAIRCFQEDPDVRIFIGNPAAAGAGITLTAAHHAIYESFSNQAAHYLQSVDRIHRRGQRHAVTYHVLLARGTVEEVEFERIVGKESAGRRLLGDKYEKPMTRERFLAELGASDE